MSRSGWSGRNRTARAPHLLVPALLVALIAACTASDRTAAGWGVGASSDGGGGVEGDVSPDEPDTAVGAPCEPADPPKCEGGNVYEETTDAGCRISRCYCADWARYDEERGKCVDALNGGSPGEACERDVDCTTGVCDTRYLGSEDQGRCIPECEVDEPEVCPDGWMCFVPGDVAGYCLPRCSCGGDDCGQGRSCAGRREQRCLHRSNVDEWELTCTEPADWCERACESLDSCETPPLGQGECLRRCDNSEEAECLYNTLLGEDGLQRDCSTAPTCLD